VGTKAGFLDIGIMGTLNIRVVVLCLGRLIHIFLRTELEDHPSPQFAQQQNSVMGSQARCPPYSSGAVAEVQRMQRPKEFNC
jgi:hypothetical protein